MERRKKFKEKLRRLYLKLSYGLGLIILFFNFLFMVLIANQNPVLWVPFFVNVILLIDYIRRIRKDGKS